MIGREIIEIFGEKGLDVFIVGVGIGGIIIGVFCVLKKVNFDVVIYVVEVDEFVIFFGE